MTEREPKKRVALLRMNGRIIGAGSFERGPAVQIETTDDGDRFGRTIEITMDPDDVQEFGRRLYQNVTVTVMADDEVQP